ncbi:MAG: hypothetical protein FJW35_09420 [Acidobacteria bacterium]|nr:hypothetical protein [Acidobacteriota bacterium]
MWIVDKRNFFIGAFMAVTFLAVLALMFSPLFGGENAFQASDRLFNSIAKGSSNYFASLREECAAFQDAQIDVEITLQDPAVARQAGSLLQAAGMQVEGSGGRLQVSGRLGSVTSAALDDSEALFHNRGQDIAAKRGFPERNVLHAWWSALKEMQKVLRFQGQFAPAALLEELTMRGVEVAYNFHGIEPRKASANAGVLTFALLFYIFYTLWWGYAILYLFNGLGMQMKAAAKKEV